MISTLREFKLIFTSQHISTSVSRFVFNNIYNSYDLKIRYKNHYKRYRIVVANCRYNNTASFVFIFNNFKKEYIYMYIMMFQYYRNLKLYLTFNIFQYL